MKSWLVNDGIILMVECIFFDYYADITQFHNSLHPYITQISAKFFLAVCWKGNDLKWGKGVSEISILQKQNGKRFGVFISFLYAYCFFKGGMDLHILNMRNDTSSGFFAIAMKNIAKAKPARICWTLLNTSIKAGSNGKDWFGYGGSLIWSYPYVLISTSWQIWCMSIFQSVWAFGIFCSFLWWEPVAFSCLVKSGFTWPTKKAALMLPG